MSNDLHNREMRVCMKCGWCDGFGHDNHCWPKAGAVARKLVEQLNKIENVTATQLGYGDHTIAFTIGGTLTTVLRFAGNERTLSHAHTFGMSDLLPSEVASLGGLLAGWFTEVAVKRVQREIAAEKLRAMAVKSGKPPESES